VPNEEARQAKALEGIERYVKQLVPIFKTINQNLVDFAKIAQTNEKNALEELNKHLAPEGYEFKKDTILTPKEWQDRLGRHWKYKDGAKLVDPEHKITAEQFFYLMQEFGVEVPGKKEQIESDRCGGCGLLYCEIEDCGSPKENLDKKLSCGCTLRDHKFGEHLGGE